MSECFLSVTAISHEVFIAHEYSPIQLFYTGSTAFNERDIAFILLFVVEGIYPLNSIRDFFLHIH